MPDTRIGDYVKAHLPEIIAYCGRDSSEFGRLRDARYSRDTFGLNWPFLAVTSAMPSGGHKRYWVKQYSVGTWQVRACSQWYDRQQGKFDRYLRRLRGTGGLPAPPVLPVAPSPRPWGKARYRKTAVGDAQNLVIRVILSNLGSETFGGAEWERAKQYFGNRCAYCGHEGPLQLDHAIPINKDRLGEHRLGNLVPSCGPCNAEKHHRDFREFLRERIGGTERIERIEQYMRRMGYVPLPDDPAIKEFLTQAHAEIVKSVAGYVERLDRLLEARGTSYRQ